VNIAEQYPELNLLAIGSAPGGRARLTAARAGEIVMEITLGLDDLGIREVVQGTSQIKAHELIKTMLRAREDRPWPDPPGEPWPACWLVFESSADPLAVLPWEELLTDWLEAPVLRLARHPVRPVAGRSALAVAICVDTAGWLATSTAVDRVLDLVTRLRVSAPGKLRVDLFSETAVAEKATSDKKWPSETEVRTHLPPARFKAQPPDLVKGKRPTPAPPGWFSWIASEYEGRSADLVCLICPSMLDGPHGVLAMTQAPAAAQSDHAATPLQTGRDADARRLVTAAEIDQLLLTLGSWSIALCDPTGGVGVGALGHQLADVLPGPVLVDWGISRGGGGDENYRELQESRRTAPIPVARGMGAYLNPDGTTWTAPPVSTYEGIVAYERRDRHTQLLKDHTLAGRTAGLLEDIDTPAWLASNQRLLEHWMAPLLEPEPEDAVPKAYREGLSNGLAFLAETLERYAGDAPVKGGEPA
jgi:hypothetical protein